MRQISEQELKDILNKHGKWLRSENGGAKANLYGAGLSGANLSRANLSGANLSRADLSRANLSGANLSRADLYGADLSRANLSGADLYGADLSRANLSGANLSGANLSGANLSRANLSVANLSRANLYGADLSETILQNKIIMSFQFQQHAAYFCGQGKIKIGCEEHSIEHWLANYKQIGQKHTYTEEQIAKYGKFIKGCQKAQKECK